MFRLPVTEDIVRDVAFCHEVGEAQNVQCLHRLVGLSLVESATVYATQQQEYRVTTILEPLLQPMLTVEEWQITRKSATASIYKTWWEDRKEFGYCKESQAQEIVKLAVLAEEKEIAIAVGYAVANNWLNTSRVVGALEICQEILQLSEDYRILGSIAQAENHLGFVRDAMIHYQKALELCPGDDLKTKATILHCIANVKTRQGDIKGAMSLCKQSLQICDSINDVTGKAATLCQIARLKAEQGDISLHWVNCNCTCSFPLTDVNFGLAFTKTLMSIICGL
ncbi:MAG: tetratricopeptide repeat protein [Calothrix sp. CSU_2_0]|nr:tetratricopeptide repeat protein [Calothrix sp. CSU_2_0]